MCVCVCVAGFGSEKKIVVITLLHFSIDFELHFPHVLAYLTILCSQCLESGKNVVRIGKPATHATTEIKVVLFKQ